jgi:hypothetical protein
LKGDDGFAGAGGHGEEDAAFTLEDGLDDTVDGDLLVVARVFAGGEIGRGEKAFGNGFGEFFGGAEALPEFGGSGDFGEFAFLAGDEIEFDEGLAVGGVGELEAEHGRVFFGLLETVAGFFVNGFGFDNGEKYALTLSLSPEERGSGTRAEIRATVKSEPNERLAVPIKKLSRKYALTLALSPEERED